MKAEFSVYRVHEYTQITREMAAVMKLVEFSELPYQLTPSAVCVEGEWEELLSLIRKCHECVREASPHVLTTISIEDEEGFPEKIARDIRSVEEKLRHPLKGREPKIRHVKPSKMEYEHI